ncbi:MAG TPA: HAD hydrolase-like protein [Candidatus Jeotgalibaca merdavium]|uniref:HAD family hydrolase n=2 Tax=Jeotgalibaca TaxID=1470540 RepID=A0A6G7K8K2_9LACT|nr:HAD hydrolase-like protein [Jeotgalibaca arthritidis]QII81578.1 HAD family hydrolase [Jeotgalibaca arthritidis]HJA90683.1 HAD hydrolase-like protein [Candidatus Jeotgalibaca merdavium]
MTERFLTFEKQNDFLVCVDSDGCAMDTMDVKHERFFGPFSADVYGIKDRETYLEDWNRINLFSSTRGVNRFKALVMALVNAQERGEDVGDITALREWAETASSLSNDAIVEILATNPSDDFEKAFDWSKRVNHAIETELVGEDRPFDGAKEGLEHITKLADVAIVSSANREAVESEWERHGLLDSVDAFYAQDRGSKAEAIADLLTKGYDEKHVLMVGDAPGDEAAADKNNVSYFPILFGQEKASWDRLVNEALPKFLNGEFTQEYQDSLKKEFHELLSKYD